MHSHVFVKIPVFFLAAFCLALSSCSDEFEIRRGIEGRWKIESIRWMSPELNDPNIVIRPVLLIDSLLIPANGLFDFARCKRRDNQHPGCEVTVSMLGGSIKPYLPGS
jgi:hypothetical protein